MILLWSVVLMALCANSPERNRCLHSLPTCHQGMVLRIKTQIDEDCLYVKSDRPSGYLEVLFIWVGLCVSFSLVNSFVFIVKFAKSTPDLFFKTLCYVIVEGSVKWRKRGKRVRDKKLNILSRWHVHVNHR